MHPTRPHLAWFFLLSPVLMAGCTSTMGSRFGGTPQAKSIAVVGDRPVSVASGEPGGQVVADASPEPKLNPKARISGRVVDERGEPVANATVRLADGGTKGGKDIRGTTDESGAFTLNGLRPGSTYSLIAETDDDRGALTGRARAKTAATDVEIAILSDEAAAKATTRKNVRPGLKTRPISSREEISDEPAETGGSAINREDLALPAESADTLDPGPQPEAGRPQLIPPQATTGWQNAQSARKARPKTADSETLAASGDASPRRPRSAPVRAVPQDDEEGENPLPPAIEPGQDVESSVTKPTSARLKPANRPIAQAPNPRPATGEMSLAPEASANARPRSLDTPDTPTTAAVQPSVAAPVVVEASGLLPEPGAMAKIEPSTPPVSPERPGSSEMPPVGAGGGAITLTAIPPGPPPTSSVLAEDIAPSTPASQPVFASREPAAPAQTNPADYNPFALVAANPPESARPAEPAPAAPAPPAAPEDLVATAPAPTGPKTKWGDLAAKPAPAIVKIEPTKTTLASSIVKRFRPAPVAKVEKVDPSIAQCSYDARLRTLKDFRLPDLDGRPVRFQDLDADFVLLDFWGTWCAPCLESIPHLVELQKRYGPTRLRVVGIACEDVAPEQRKAKVDEVARKLGINYTVLLSTMDGKPCPVQSSFAIQAMPTMILLNRKGEVLWRSTGSTAANETRLDRVLASQMSWSETARR